MITALLSLSLVVTALLVAKSLGDEPETYGAAIFALMLALPFGGHLLFPRIFVSADPIAFFTDAVGFVGFAAIALLAWRIWPIWAASLQLLALTAHMIRMFEIQIEPLVYAVMMSGPTYLVFLTLLIGTWTHRRRIRIYGKDRCWRSWYMPWNRTRRNQSR